MNPLAQKDLQYVWHPFTQMQEWSQQEPLVITSGKGALLRDQHGKSYLDANASIWTNLHGHTHPRINRSIRRQLARISHSSALGLANEPASLLAEQLIKTANHPSLWPRSSSSLTNPKLRKVFFSDDGSTALETALKMAYEHAMRRGISKHPRFLSLDQAYHGDTVGAVSLGQVPLFHRAYDRLLFRTDKVMSPYCYRCPFNRAKAERGDARLHRRCQWECVQTVERRLEQAQSKGQAYAGWVVEPVVQGVAGMVVQPEGWLKRVGRLARQAGIPLIFDEVMTGFGRTGPMFASHGEGVQADFLCLAKGMSGGYLPMAATLVTDDIFRSFLGSYASGKTFYHGHSFTGNQLGAAASLESLRMLKDLHDLRWRKSLSKTLAEACDALWGSPHVGDIRQTGTVVGVELVKNWKTKEAWDSNQRVGQRVCEAMALHGVLTRPIGDVIVLMPPYCCTPGQIRRMVRALHRSLAQVLGS